MRRNVGREERNVGPAVADGSLFAGSPLSARAAAVYYTLVGTCLLQGIDPKRYLVEILGRLDEPVSRLTPQGVRETWEAAAMKPPGMPPPSAGMC